MLDIKTASPLNDIEAERRPPSPQSMLGQASMDTDAIEGDYDLSDWNSFNMDIRSLGLTQDLTDIIMQVKSDEKSNMLMEGSTPSVFQHIMSLTSMDMNQSLNLLRQTLFVLRRSRFLQSLLI